MVLAKLRQLMAKREPLRMKVRERLVDAHFWLMNEQTAAFVARPAVIAVLIKKVK